MLLAGADGTGAADTALVARAACEDAGAVDAAVAAICAVVDGVLVVT